jgi:hypothetical protein
MTGFTFAGGFFMKNKGFEGLHFHTHRVSVVLVTARSNVAQFARSVLNGANSPLIFAHQTK